MKLRKIGILTDKESWLNRYIGDFIENLNQLEMQVELLNEIYIHKNFDVLFVLSYSKIIKPAYLQLNKHNIVVHESDLPEGKGWSPLTWQIIEGKNECKISLFEASEEVDAGRIYLKDCIKLKGNELVEDIRKLQAEKTFEMCLEFLINYKKNMENSYEQNGKESFYPRRTPKDSELDINKSIKEQFNLLRTVDNEKYPAFFYLEGEKYFLKIFKEKNG